MTHRIEIQKYIIGEIEHWRARKEKTINYIFEGITADKLRRQLLKKLGGCVFLFQSDRIIK